MEQRNAVVPAVGAEREGGPMEKLYVEHIGLPAHLRCSTPPKGMKSRLATIFLDWVCPLLGLKWLTVEPFEEAGKPYYRVTTGVFFRTITFVLTPMGAYNLGLHLYLFETTERKSHSVYASNPFVGHVYVPQWARKQLMHELAAICERHHAHIDMVKSEMQRLFYKQEKVQQIEAEGTDETPKEERILH